MVIIHFVIRLLSPSTGSVVSSSFPVCQREGNDGLALLRKFTELIVPRVSVLTKPGRLLGTMERQQLVSSC